MVGKNHGQTNGIFCCPCRYTVTSEDGVGTLVIRDVRALDVAEFTCQITSRLHGDQLALPATSVLVNDSEWCQESISHEKWKKELECVLITQKNSVIIPLLYLVQTCLKSNRGRCYDECWLLD